MLKTAFLAELEPLTRNDRLRRAIEVGRRAASSDAAAALLDELRRSSEAYERLLAIVSVHGSKDGARVLEALGDPSRAVRRSAAPLVALYCDDAQAEAALGIIVERTVLRRTAARLVKRGRGRAVDAFLAARMGHGREPRIVELLPLGSEALVVRFVNDIVQAGGDACWDRLAARHPAFTARWFLADVRRATALDPRQRYRLFPRLVTFALRAPDAALELVEALFDLGEEPFQLAAPLKWLVRARPGETFDLLEAREKSGRPARPPGAFGAVSFDKVAHRLGAERLDYLVRRAWGTLSDGRRGVSWFLRLSTGDQKTVLAAFLHGGRGGWGAFLFRYLGAEGDDERALREQAFERWSRAAQATDGTISPDVLAFLPRELREREARRHLSECPALASKPDRRLIYARLLSFAEARGPELHPAPQHRPPREPHAAGSPRRSPPRSTDDREVRNRSHALGDRLRRGLQPMDGEPAARPRRRARRAAPRRRARGPDAALRDQHAGAPGLRRRDAHPAVRLGSSPTGA